MSSNQPTVPGVAALVATCLMGLGTGNAYAFEFADLFRTPAARAAERIERGETEAAIAVAPDAEWRGLAHHRAGEFEAAIDAFGERIDSAGADMPANDRARLHYNRGTSAARAGRLDDALSDLDQALRIQPSHVAAAINRERVAQLLEARDAAEREAGGEAGEAGEAGNGEQGDRADDGEDQTGDTSTNAGSGEKGADADAASAQPEADGGDRHGRSVASGQDRASSDSASDQSSSGSGTAAREMEGPSEGTAAADEAERRAAAAALDAGDTEAAARAAANGAATAASAAADSAGGDDGARSAVGEDSPIVPLGEDEQATEQWLRRIVDDPAGLLRRKLEQSHRREYPDVRSADEDW